VKSSSSFFMASSCDSALVMLNTSPFSGRSAELRQLLCRFAPDQQYGATRTPQRERILQV
jgi:hypothetical protein